MFEMAKSSKKQFDSTLGGDRVLPHALNVMEFVSSRSQEIAALSEAIDNPQRTSLVSQRLPKHMQRRIMSHNTKRLPIALRQAFIEGREKSGLPTEAKRPRRKYRRRPRNLLDEYNRRQQKFVWLETHLWHAKRFHMIDKWGYRLPDHPNDKSYRACYRASTQHCLIQDMSYYICIEINGDLDHIISGLNKLTTPQCGLTFGAKYYLDGSREGSVIIYHQGQYPYGVIGPVKFLWKSPSNETKNGERSLDNKRTLWLWIHPAYYSEFFEEIFNIFSLLKLKNSNDTSMEVDGENNHEKDSKTGEKNNNDSSNADCRNRVTRYQSSFYNDISVIELKDTINRLRLTGPLSQPILTDAFVLLSPNDVEKSSMQYESGINSFDGDDWIRRFYSNCGTKVDALKSKHEFWSKLKNTTDPSQLPAGMVIPLVIRDPRFNLPDKRKKVIADSKETDDQLIINPPSIGLLNDSPLWDQTVRDQATNYKLTTSDITQLQSKLLVSGTINDIVKEYNIKHYLPVIIVHNHSYCGTADHQRKGPGSGWDIILPSGWSMPVWLSLVWRGARAGGLREDIFLRSESNIMPLLPPDSVNGQIEDETNRQRLSEIYFRKPPAKRPNYRKLGIVAPFHYPWKQLLTDWSTLDSLPSSFFILRDKSKLNKIKLLIDNVSCNGIKNSCKIEANNYLEMSDSDAENCLVGISVRIYGRGNVSEHSVVCIPLKEDLDLLNNYKIAKNHPTELPHDDTKRTERFHIRKEHLKFLKRMKRKRKKFKSNSDFENYELLKTITLDTVESKNEVIKNLWLPSLSDISVKDSCRRKVMGYIVSGDFSFSQSCSSSQAYISLTALFDLIYNNKQSESLCGKLVNRTFVLVRTPVSLKYSFATIDLASNSFL